MLLSLHIENLAIMESQHVRFGPGLNVLSGETGAGKSIVLGALNLCLGGRATTDMVRTGANLAVVEARFQPDERTRDWLVDAGLEPAEVLVLRRQVAARGPGRAWVNGQPATLALLSELGALLVDAAGQHDQHGLLNPDEHLRFLDDAARAEGEQQAWSRAWVELRAARSSAGWNPARRARTSARPGCASSSRSWRPWPCARASTRHWRSRPAC